MIKDGEEAVDRHQPDATFDESSCQQAALPEAVHAVALDPLTSAVLSLGEIRDMFDEMWSLHGPELAAYS